MQMTLQEWADKIGVVVNTHVSGSKWVCANGKSLHGAYRLSDYVLTSRCGEVFWFMSRNP